MHLPDTALSSLNQWLQWITIVGTAFVLISSICLISVRKEISARQQKQLVAAQEEASNAIRIVDSLKTKMQPRHLSDEQRIKLSNLLKQDPKGPVTMMAIKMDQEATNYANEISMILTESGFTVAFYSGPLILNMTPGVWILVPENAEISLYALSLSRAFTQVGIPCQISPSPQIPASALYLGVGPKP